MLVLSRRKHECIVVGPSYDQLAHIFVVEIRGDKVRLGCEVPKEWVLHRKEVLDGIVRHDSSNPAKTPPD